MLPIKMLPLRKLLYTGRQKGMQEGPPQDHMATDSGERNQGDGEDLGRHQAYGKGPAGAEGACCFPTCHLSVKGMSDCSALKQPLPPSLPIHFLISVFDLKP